MKNGIIISASSGKNLELSQKLLAHLEELGGKGSIVDLTSLELPLFTTKHEEKSGVPEAAKKLKEQFLTSDYYVFVAPEYNGSTPPALNNMLAWVSRSGDDWRETFNSKPALIATHSGGGGAHVLMIMRSQLSFLGMNVLGREILTHYSKELNDETAIACLKQLI